MMGFLWLTLKLLKKLLSRFRVDGKTMVDGHVLRWVIWSCFGNKDHQVQPADAVTTLRLRERALALIPSTTRRITDLYATKLTYVTMSIEEFNCAAMPGCAQIGGASAHDLLTIYLSFSFSSASIWG